MPDQEVSVSLATGGECIGDEQLLGFVDHVLPVDETARVAQHVAICSDCRLVLSELARGSAPEPGGDEGPLRRGAMLGRYVLDDLLGAGGMGVVYSAHDPSLNRAVAVKMLKDSSHGRRFEHEKRILAGLEHPNIARLLDGGETPDGRAYLVMELVDGVPLGDYCNRRMLSVADRLRLFRDVCAAVQYAHQNLVVHRDLKPGNILVTSAGVVKLLDFGIAKLLESDDAALTATGMQAMTPAFASPEQVRRELLTTASDVYSLGVVLYELLTGVLPYRADDHDLDALLAAVRDEEPEPPSTAVARATDAQAGSRGGSRDRLRSRLSGDVDSIVLMALRKEPRARYATAEQLSEDLRRHLEGLPAAARRGNTAYRLSKFVRRHKVAVAAACTAFVSLAAGIAATAWQAREASIARDRAERRFAEVRKLAHQVLFDYHDGIAVLPGSTALRQQLVKDALGYLDTLAAESAGDASLQLELANAYVKVGMVQGDPYSASLGDTPGALASYRRAVEIGNALLGAAPGDLDAMRLLGRVQLRLADLLAVSGDMPAAITAYREAISLNTKLTARPGAAVDDRHELGADWLALGAALGEQGKLDEALEAQRISLRLREELAADHRDARTRRAVATSHVTLGDVQCKRGQAAECLKEYEEATRLYEEIVVDAPQYQTDLGPMYQRLGLALTEAGEAKRAVEVQRKSRVVNEARATADPDDATGQRMLAGSYSTLAGALMETGEHAEALELFRKALQITRTLFAGDPANTQAKRDVALELFELGEASLRVGDIDTAEKAQLEGLKISEELLASDPKGVVARSDVGDHLLELGKAKRKRGRAADALAELERAKTLYEAVFTDAPDNATYGSSRAVVYMELARARGGSDACGWWRRAVEAWRPLEEQKTVPHDVRAEPAAARAALAACDGN